MKKTWLNQLQDMNAAEQIMGDYAEHHTGVLNLFELVVDIKEKQMDFQLAPWVHALTHHFKSVYGDEEGEAITRKLISFYMRDHQTLH